MFNKSTHTVAAAPDRPPDAAAFDALPAFAWTAGPDGRNRRFNKWAVDFTGVDLNDPRGEAWMRAVHPDDLPGLLGRPTPDPRRGEPFEADFRIRAADGGYRWHRCRMAATRTPAGAVGGWVAVCTEVAAPAAEAPPAAAADARFRAFVDHIPALALVKDEGGRYLFANRAWREQFDPQPTDWLGKTDFDFWPADQAERYREEDRECLDRNETIVWDETVVTPTRGEARWRVVKFPLTAGGRRQVGFLAWDVTDRRQADATVELLHRAIEAVPHGIVIADAQLPDLPIIYASPAFEAITGYPLAETIGQNARFLQGPKTEPAAVDRLRRAVATATPVTVELTNHRKDGTPFASAMSVSPIYADGRLTHFVGVQADVTERRALEDQFRQAQKMEAVGVLAGGISHDFNNLLTVVLGYCDIAAEQLPDGPVRGYVREIRAAGQRAAALTRQLLAFSRADALEPRPLDANDLLADLGGLLRPLLGDGIELAADLAPDLGRVLADPGQLEQAVMNLCINARDAMPGGGTLTLVTRNAPPAGPADPPAGVVRLAVRDTGTGMTDEVKARAFEPFFTTKGPGRGTGLGLAMVFGFAKQSGGSVEVDSGPGRGSEFALRLPRVDGPAVPKPHTRVTVAPRGGETVLVVEDEAAVRALTRRVLEGCGYVVLEAADGPEALRLAAEYRGPIHLIVSDAVLPDGGTGPQVAAALRPAHPGLKVLFVTGPAGGPVDGAAYLPKPFTPAALTQKVRDVFDAPA